MFTYLCCSAPPGKYLGSSPKTLLPGGQLRVAGVVVGVDMFWEVTNKANIRHIINMYPMKCTVYGFRALHKSYICGHVPKMYFPTS